MALPGDATFSWEKLDTELIKRSAMKPYSFFDKFIQKEGPMSDEHKGSPGLTASAVNSMHRRTGVEREMDSLKRRFPELWTETMRQSRDIHQHREKLTRAIIERMSDHDLQDTHAKVSPPSLKNWFSDEDMKKIKDSNRVFGRMGFLDDPVTKKPAYHLQDEKLLLLLPPPL